MILYYILIVMAPMPNHPLFEMSIAGLSIVKWLGMLCCGYATFRLMQRKRMPAFLQASEFNWYLVLLALATVSYFTLSKPEGLTFSPMAMYFNYLLLFVTTLALVNNSERLRYALLASVAGAAITSLYVIREFQASGGTNLRPGYVAGDSNYFATCVLLILPMAVYFVRLQGPRWQRWFCAASVIVILIAFTLASSRGGLVGLCVAILYMVARSGHSRRGAVAMAVFLLPLLLASPASPLSRMLRPNYGDFVGAQIRRDFWQVGLKMISNHPITGIGLGNFTAHSVTETQGVQNFHGLACNTFLETTAELGFPGLIAYSGVLVAAFLSAGRLRREGKKLKNAFFQCAGQAIQAGLLGFAGAALFVSAQYQKPFWIMVALSACVSPVLRDYKQRSERLLRAKDANPERTLISVAV
jgi:O-antigen ligase